MAPISMTLSDRDGPFYCLKPYYVNAVCIIYDEFTVKCIF